MLRLKRGVSAAASHAMKRAVSIPARAALPLCYTLARPIGATPQGRFAIYQCGKPSVFGTSVSPVLQQRRGMADAGKAKMVAPKMVYISGEEMTHYCMNLIMDKWIKPHVDTSAWEFYDCSCKHRDATDDKVLRDAVEAGARIGAIFKEPTITPSAEQTKSMGLKKQLPSPNGAMRRVRIRAPTCRRTRTQLTWSHSFLASVPVLPPPQGWNGVTISRDTIHIEGLKLGYEKPVLFERHAVGGEYQAGYKTVCSCLSPMWVPACPCLTA